MLLLQVQANCTSHRPLIQNQARFISELCKCADAAGVVTAFADTRNPMINLDFELMLML